MSKNLVTKSLSGQGVFNVPAGVKKLQVLESKNNTGNLLESGDSFSATCSENKAVYAWGVNFGGILGDGTEIDRSSPVQVVGGQSFVGLHVGDYSTYAIKENGEVWSWGGNFDGQLGDGTTVSKSSPVQVVGEHSFIELNVSLPNINDAEFILALKENGEAWGWGRNSVGFLGDGTTVSKSSPVQVIGGHSFVDISVGGSHVLALKENGEVWAWGLNSSFTGGLGDGTTVSKSSPVQVIGGHSFSKVYAVDSYSLALKENGEAWAWGDNSSGELGDGDAPTPKSSPVEVLGSHSFVELFTGRGYTQALKENGEAWAWGSNDNGELGDGTTGAKQSPVQVIGGHTFTKIICGFSQVFGIKENGEAWSWGANYAGQLGDGTTVSKSSPVQVIGGHSFVDIVGGTGCYFGIKENGEILAWGANFAGQLGDGTTVDKSSPVEVLGGIRVNLEGKVSNPKGQISVNPGDSVNYDLESSTYSHFGGISVNPRDTTKIEYNS